MNGITAIWLRLKALVLRQRLDRDLEDELAFHLAMREKTHGDEDGEARYAARRQFGNVSHIKEVCREMRTFLSFEAFWQDLRFGGRGLRKNPGFAVVSVLTLALGIGASTTFFNMLRQWVINAAAFPQGDRLVVVWKVDTKKGWLGAASAPDFMEWRAQPREFASLSAWVPRPFNFTGQDTPQRISGARVSPDFFRTMGIQPTMGRDFQAAEDQPGTGHVAMISSGLWHDLFNSAPNVLGKDFILDSEHYTIIGVVPENFHFTMMGRANIWVPLVLTDKERTDRTSGSGGLNIIGRLKPGVSLATAQQSMNTIARQLEKDYPQTNANSGIFLNPLSKQIAGDDEPIFYMCFVVGICILFIGCSNIAGIYLTRSFMRRKEMTLRLALGARRTRLARQLLSENLLLLPAAVGLGLGLALFFGNWITASFSYDRRGSLPNYGQIYMDWAAFAFASGICLFSVLLFSLAPMLEGRKLNLTSVLKNDSGSVTTSFAARQLRKGLVVLEIVLALVVLVPAGLTAKSLVSRSKVDLGFNPDHVLIASIALPSAKYQQAGQQTAFYNQLIDRVRSLPSVEAAGLSQYIPFGRGGGAMHFHVDGQPAPSASEFPIISSISVTPEYFAAIGIQLVRGRFIAQQDNSEAQPVIVINQTLARRFFPHEDPLGHVLHLGNGDTAGHMIVGVAKDIKFYSPAEPPQNQGYTSFVQSPSRAMTILVRTNGDPLALATALRNSVWAVDRNQPVSELGTLSQRVKEEETGYQVLMQITSGFALLALFLAAIGIYGVMAHLVASRKREIGIRMACGAQPKTILWLVLSGNLKLITVGVPAGLLLAWAVARLMQNILYGVKANDPATYGTAVAVLCAAVLLASIAPLRRATKVDPMIVLRYE